MTRLSLILFFALASTPYAWSQDITVRDEGTIQGRAREINCVGGGVACTVTSGVATATVPVAFRVPGLRLTTETGVSVSTSDRTSQGTIYWTPHIDGVVVCYNGSALEVQTLTSDKSLALTVTSGSNYDVFYDCDGAALALSSAWTNDTTRANAISRHSSCACFTLGSDATKLWLGTIRASGSNVVEDSKNKPWVVNVYNRISRPLYAAQGTSHLYTSTWREWNGGTGAVRVELLIPDLSYQPFLNVSAQITVESGGGLSQTSLAIDSTTTPGNLMLADNELIIHNQVATQDETWRLSGSLIPNMGSVGIGYHYVAFVEQGQGNGGTWTAGNITGWMER